MDQITSESFGNKDLNDPGTLVISVACSVTMINPKEVSGVDPETVRIVNECSAY